ncbi:MAG TPA: FAD-dependent oxidoreductase, partial [Armatimonadota bacterium]|nr:FAD-dependent oxidoreductase [Armatimonadota bacterium]
YRMGREGKEVFGESLAPDEPDNMTHGSTLYFAFHNVPEPADFSDLPWATEITRDHIEITSDHTWEYGHWRHMINDAEEIRDYMLRAIYGNLVNLKQKFAEATKLTEYERVGYIAARGESRRLMGDYILTQGDIQSQRDFPDGVATGSLVFCLHYPREDYDFRNRLDLRAVEPYEIPFRCLYSRNVTNLMMAGRDISATHIAYCSTKLQKTGGQMGRAVGAAAALCAKHGTTPRGVYERHIAELQDIVEQKGAYEEALAPSGADE